MLWHAKVVQCSLTWPYFHAGRTNHTKDVLKSSLSKWILPELNVFYCTIIASSNVETDNEHWILQITLGRLINFINNSRNHDKTEVLLETKRSDLWFKVSLDGVAVHLKEQICSRGTLGPRPTCWISKWQLWPGKPFTSFNWLASCKFPWKENIWLLWSMPWLHLD